MTNNTATTTATTAATSADKLAAALDAATEPLSQAALALAAGVGRSTATTWLGQQVAKGLAERIMHEKGPATFARPLAACDDEPDREPTAAAEEAWDAREEWIADPAGAEDIEAEIEADRQAAVAADPEIPAPPAEAEAELDRHLREVGEAVGGTPVVATNTCHCGGDITGHVRGAVGCAHEKAAPRARRARSGGTATKGAAWAAAEKALTEAGAEGLPVPALWEVLQGAGLALSGAYALVNAKRTDGTLTTAAEARVLKDRRYALASTTA